MKSNNIKGIIFDMDNTLLHSKIDFAAMKQDTYDYIIKLGLLPEDPEFLNLTTARIIEMAAENSKMTQDLLEEIWGIPINMKYLEWKMLLRTGVEQLIKNLYGNITWLLLQITL